jgi:hypothetical protein
MVMAMVVVVMVNRETWRVEGKESREFKGGERNGVVIEDR